MTKKKLKQTAIDTALANILIPKILGIFRLVKRILLQLQYLLKKKNRH